jgi:3-oxoacyl-(acyl-carrier-protein) synthase/surfactin synthase thioesterase subunit
MTDEKLLFEALHTIQRLNEKVAGYESAHDIAIVGMSAQLPEAPNLKAFWEQLCARYDGVSHFPSSRLALLGMTEEELGTSVTNIHGGYLDAIDLFDAELFGISPREARCMDPQQRLLLMNTHQALLDAELLGGDTDIRDVDIRSTGVFVSHYASQYMRFANRDPENALFVTTGNALSISANRISYHYNFNGPSLVVDTACSSSLVGLDIACHYLREKAIDYAVVAGISLNLNPHFTRLLQDSRMLAPDGKCKTFDESANGYVPGEGVGVIVLQRLDDSRRRGSKVYAVVAGSAVNQDGKSNGLTAPNGLAQERVIASAFSRAKLDPSRAHYIETHGTGTFLGDPVEIEALGNIINAGRDPQRPCILGCLKTNIGHLEPAAGIAGVIKAALSIHQNKIPGNNHLNRINPLLRMDGQPFLLPDRVIDWPEEEKIAGVSSFGFGGVNGHVVLRNAPADVSRGDLLASYPIHPFKLKSYWAEAPKESTTRATTNATFLDLQVIDSPTERLRLLLTIEKGNLLGVGDTGNFHIGFYIETIHKIFATHFGAPQIHIASIEFLRLLYISRQADTLIQIVVRESSDDLFALEFHFKYAAAGSRWILAARATVEPLREETEILAAPKPPAVAPAILDEARFYDRYMAMGYPGMGFVRVVSGTELFDRESFSTLRLEFDPRAYSLGVHPGFLDAVLQPGFVMHDDSASVLHMTTVMKDIRILGALPQDRYGLYNRLLDGDGFRMSWSIYDAGGDVRIDCRETTLQSLTQDANALEAMAAFERERDEPLTPEGLLVEIASMLECEPSEINRNLVLLELGMDSLMIMKLQSILDGFELPINNLFEMSVQQLQTLIARQSSPAPAAPLRDLTSPSNDKSAWLRGVARADARMRLYCFPYGHLSAAMFRNWVKTFPPEVEVRPIELPGRGERLKERPIESLSELAERLTNILGDELDRPYAMLGHSAGTLLAYAWCLHLQRHALPMPKVLFAGAFTAPCLPFNPVVEGLRSTYRRFGIGHIPTLDEILDPRNAAFVEKVIDALTHSMNEIGLFSLSREFIHAQLPAIVATFRSVETFDARLVAPLPIPIVALHGRRDAQVSRSDMQAWQRLTTDTFTLHEFGGDHSFINAEQDEAEVMERVASTLSAAELRCS